MAGPLLVLWLGVATGFALGLLPARAGGWAVPLRAVAALSALLVCALQLVPHVVEAWGTLWSLACVALVWGGLGWVQQGCSGARALTADGSESAAGGGLRARALVCVGLAAHWVADGVVLSTESHGAGVAVALVAHQAPVVALVVLDCARVSRFAAALAAAGLGLSASSGFVLADRLSAVLGERAHTWTDAVAAGLLLHLAWHQLAHLWGAARQQERGRTWGCRAEGRP